MQRAAELTALLTPGSICAVCMVAFMLSWFFYRSFYAHCIFLAFVSLVATWNGSCFYFDYFAFRYVPSLGLEHKNRSDSSKKSE